MMNEHATQTSAPTVDLKLEVVVIPVSDVDRAKRFYGRQQLAASGDQVAAVESILR